MPHFVPVVPSGIAIGVTFTKKVRFDGNWNYNLAGDETEYIFMSICLEADTYRDEFQCNPQTAYYVVLISTATSDYKRKKGHW